MNKKNKLFMFVGIAVAILAIVAILLLLTKRAGTSGNNQNGTTTPTQSSSDDKITILYWGLWEPDSVMESLIEKYEAQNPGIDIQYTQKPFNQYETNTYTRLSQGVSSSTSDSSVPPAPDILRINNTWLPKYQDYLYPMPSSIMTSQQYAQTFYPTAVRDFTGSDSNIYAIPLEIDGLAVFYNKKLLAEAGYDAPPTDWDSFTEAAIKLTKKDSYGKITQAGAALGSSKNIMHSVDILNLLFLQNQVQILSTDGKSVSISTARAAQTLDFYKDFTATHNTWSIDSRSDLELFYSGSVAMIFAPSWRAFDIIQAAPQVEFGIAPVPQLTNNTAVNYSMYWGEAVSKKSAHPQEAWKFIKYLSEQTQMKEMYSNSAKVRAFGEPYSRTDLASELTTNPYTAAFMQMAPTMKSWKMGEQSFVEDSLRTAIYDACERDVETSTALKDAEERINEKLADLYK